ncbi:hypothetical protein AF72_12940 [Xylella taiwanensis]|uniref:Uncharacterized protein n=1 Tax=Xylella taiwanensis TaxID=1444770 RepID=Z9JGC3_9GAMM|nr:hypothetical protein AF72_12940 [Xylella taiwanensis]
MRHEDSSDAADARGQVRYVQRRHSQAARVRMLG